MPRLPPVLISPQARLRARLAPGVICSVVTFFQSHSSSSATSWARPVIVPWPISERAMRITQVSSGLMATHTLTSAPSVAPCGSAAPKPDGRLKPSASPPPAAAEPMTNLRRESFADLLRMILFMAAPSGSGRIVGRHVDGGAYALIGAAATDVGHRLVDVVVARLGCSLEEGRGRHDLAGLAIAALGHVDRRPRLLHWMRAVGRKAFDRDDPVGGAHVSDANGAGALHLIVDVHGAGAALGHAATVFRAGETDLLADDPQERGVRLYLHVADIAVDVELCHELPLAELPSTRTLVVALSMKAGRRALEGIENTSQAVVKHSALGTPRLRPSAACRQQRIIGRTFPAGIITANIHRARKEKVDASPQTPIRSFVANHDVRIEVLAQGDGRGRVIVLLPSLGRGASDFDPIAERLLSGRAARRAPRT